MASYVHGDSLQLQDFRDGSTGRRPSVQELLDLIDTDDPTWPATAAATREMTKAGVEIGKLALEIAAKLGAYRLAGLKEVKIHGREVPCDPWRQDPFPSIVYYIRRGPVIKIGTTTAAITRFMDLMPDEILAFEPGANKENFRHRQFQHLRCHGEHFRPAPELLEHIRRTRDQYGDPSAPPRVALLAKETDIRMTLPPLASEEKMTAAEAEERLGIGRQMLRGWVNRRKLSVAGYGEHGEELFYAEHLAALWNDPREARRW